LLVAVVTISNIWDYRQSYRQWYAPLYSTQSSNQLPTNLVSPFDPYYSAELVKAINVTNQPILADNPATLYYAKKEYWQGTAQWYGVDLGQEDKMIAAINSRAYKFLVFTYKPNTNVLVSILLSGYKVIGPGLWMLY
jgi:hypothetical protein